MKGANVIYFLGQKEEKYDISKLLANLLSKNIPLKLYVKTKNVIENVIVKESVFIIWDHNSMNVIYLPCAFEGEYILNVSNLLENFLDKKSFMFTTHKTILTIDNLLLEFHLLIDIVTDLVQINWKTLLFFL